MSERQDLGAEETAEESAQERVQDEIADAEDLETPAPAEEAGAGEEGDPDGELDDLRRRLEETTAKEAEYLDGWQRARAELSNARKRFRREQEQAYSNARADMLARLLPVVDDLERAFESLPENPVSQTWVEGVSLVLHKLQVLLEQEGVTAIESAGQPFDPMKHQAVTHELSDTVPEGHVIAEVQKGYLFGERVLRPSVVRVSSGPPSEPESELEEEPAREGLIQQDEIDSDHSN